MQFENTTTTKAPIGGAPQGPLDRRMVTRVVLFVEQSPMGELARQIKEQAQRLEPILGYKLRVVERTRRDILSSFPQAGSWKGRQCGRGKCVTCNQGGEETLDSTRATVVHESIYV